MYLPPGTDYVLSDCRIVLADRVIPRGWVAVSRGRIADVGEGKAPERGISLDGDTLVPGLVELHTDHLEMHIQPRPSVRWHPLSAVLAYDAQIAAAGITTVFDCLRVGGDADNGPDLELPIRAAEAITSAQRQGFLRSDHRTHLRCEVCSNDVVDSVRAFLARFPAALVSLMDHTPGQRQFRDIEKANIYYGYKSGMNEKQLAVFFAERVRLHECNAVRHRRELVGLARERAIPIASHDDTTLEHVAASKAEGACIAEFPTTLEAAAASHAAGISVLMGAPNLVLGGSHSGNIATAELARDGMLDLLSSDYIPASLIQAAFGLPERVPSISLPQAMAKVTRAPARAVGLNDRGEIAPGLRADLVRVHLSEVPVVREVYREGTRIV
jgi:alpha-D-ribose 1-methylphosphonate 5-triphosphate diphosphatase